jgi:hypothetical protein
MGAVFILLKESVFIGILLPITGEVAYRYASFPPV